MPKVLLTNSKIRPFFLSTRGKAFFFVALASESNDFCSRYVAKARSLVKDGNARDGLPHAEKRVLLSGAQKFGRGGGSELPTRFPTEDRK